MTQKILFQFKTNLRHWLNRKSFNWQTIEHPVSITQNLQYYVFVTRFCCSTNTNSNSFIDQNQPYIDYKNIKACKREKNFFKQASAGKKKTFQYRWFFLPLFRRKQSCNYKTYDVNLLLKRDFFSFL